MTYINDKLTKQEVEGEQTEETEGDNTRKEKKRGKESRIGHIQISVGGSEMSVTVNLKG